MTEMERLRALADWHRRVELPTGCLYERLADMFDCLADRHRPVSDPGLRGSPVTVCAVCAEQFEAWPCPDVRAALAVADALGIEP